MRPRNNCGVSRPAMRESAVWWTCAFAPQRPRQPVGAGVELLARDRQQGFRGRQRPGGGAQFGAAMLLGARP